MDEIPFDVPAALLATAMPGVLLAQLVLAAGHVRLSYEAALRWPTVVRRVAGELGKEWAEIDAVLPEGGVDEDGETIRPLRFIKQISDQLEAAAAEAEAAVAEASDATGQDEDT